MTVSTSIQPVVMAAGKGSRMTDLTCTKAKCLLPVAGYPLVWHPLNMLQTNGFTEAIVIVPDGAKNEIIKIPEKYSLKMKLDVVTISGQEDMGTADSLRLVADKLVGRDILIVSGDLILEESLRGVIDLHRMKSAACTALLAKNSVDLKNIVVPGDKKKFKKERDFIGLKGDHLCMMTAEADVEEEEVRISDKVMRSVGSFNINTSLLDAHLYIMKKWLCDFIVHDRNLSAIKGEVIPIIVKKQFSSIKGKKENEDLEKNKLIDFVEQEKSYGLNPSSRLYSCYAYVTELPCFRVNNVPAFWHCNNILRKENKIHPGASLGDKAQLSSCYVAAGCQISDKTTLSSVSLGSGCQVLEKVRISNSVIMDNVTIKSGTVIEDCVLSDGVVIGEKCSIKNSILGKSQKISDGGHIASQLLLDADKMMEVEINV